MSIITLTKHTPKLDSPGQGSSDIEITPAMIDAGRDELRGYEKGEGETEEEIVKRVFLAMLEAAGSQ